MKTLQVFFGQADAALVSKAAFDLACELNPQLTKKVAVLSESPPLITAFFMFRPITNRKESWPKVEKAILDLHKTPGGRQLLTIIQSRKMVKWDPSVLDGTIEFIKKHRQLVKKPMLTEILQ